MQARIIFPLVFLISGCQLFPFKNFPMEIKAVIDGEIKGHKIHCEKKLDLVDGRWGVMCDVGNDMDVKYRVRPMSNDLTQIEFVVGKIKEGKEKLIAAPTVLVKKTDGTRTTTSSSSANITILAERIK